MDLETFTVEGNLDSGELATQTLVSDAMAVNREIFDWSIRGLREASYSGVLA